MVHFKNIGFAAGFAAISLLLVGAHAPSQEHAAPASRQITVCVTAADFDNCTYGGPAGLQEAIDAASSGDVLYVRKGVYMPTQTRHVTYKQLIVPSFAAITGKNIDVVGEEGAVFDGGDKIKSTAFTIKNARVSFKNITLQNFKYDAPEDDTYDGHGLFIIDSDVDVRGVTFLGIQKMSLIGRGDSNIQAENLTFKNNHMGIWLEESAHLRLVNSSVMGSESAGIATYAHASAKIYNSVFDTNLDDGIFSSGNSTIYVSNTVIVRNKPYGVRAVGTSEITVAYSAYHENAENDFNDETAQLNHLEGTLYADPLVDFQYQPQAGSPLLGAGDLDLRLSEGSPSDIGLYGVQKGQAADAP
ncbi:MAG: right-handed parallel beta-helix repeat-containing protein [Kordiimonadaceae bacterium]|nr:right-handed parallel beta-helix repeat-containing protein [Kordiimonadaceae bacterium]